MSPVTRCLIKKASRDQTGYNSTYFCAIDFIVHGGSICIITHMKTAKKGNSNITQVRGFEAAMAKTRIK